jgi:GntR family transcriptional repressor for pyruvate dehydrogenase complex
VALTDEAIAKIKAMILSGRLAPGARLPREPDLAAELGLSRNSLREAVKALSVFRVLEVRQGDGTYVSSLEPAILLDAMAFLMEFHSDDSILHILEVRRILEPAATAMVARVGTVEQVAQLREMARQDTLGTPAQDLVTHDLAFHSAIAATSGNPVLAGMLDSIAMPTSRARVWRGLTQQDAVASTIEQHLGIVEAIAAGDAVLAEARAIVHIAGVQEWITLARKLTG